MIAIIVKAVKVVIDFVAKVLAWLLIALGLWVPLIYSLVYVLVVLLFINIPLENTATVYFFGLFLSFIGALWFSLIRSAHKSKKKQRQNIGYNVSEVRKKSDRSARSDKADRSENEVQNVIRETPDREPQQTEQTYDPRQAVEPVSAPAPQYQQSAPQYEQPRYEQPAPQYEQPAPRYEQPTYYDRDRRYDRGPENFDTYRPMEGQTRAEPARDRWEPQRPWDEPQPKAQSYEPRFDQPRNDYDRQNTDWTRPSSSDLGYNRAEPQRPWDEPAQRPWDESRQSRRLQPEAQNSDQPQNDFNRSNTDWSVRPSRDGGTGWTSEPQRPWDEPVQRPKQNYDEPQSTMGMSDGQPYGTPRYSEPAPERQYMREPPVKDEIPGIFRLRNEPDVLVYEYSDRLDYYRRTAQGNVFLRRKYK